MPLQRITEAVKQARELHRKDSRRWPRTPPARIDRHDPVIAEVEAADEVDEFRRQMADEELREPVEV